MELNPNNFLFLGNCKGATATGSCCTESLPCQANEGDCDSDVDCAGSLVCGTDNCNTVSSGFPDNGYDCCVVPSKYQYKMCKLIAYRPTTHLRVTNMR